jgi:hypothetical protein
VQVFYGASTFKRGPQQWYVAKVSDMTGLLLLCFDRQRRPRQVVRCEGVDADDDADNHDDADDEAATGMTRIFIGDASFNGDVSTGYTAEVNDPTSMGLGNSSFVGDLSESYVAKVTT